MRWTIATLAGLLAASGGAVTGYHYRPDPSPSGIPVWVTAALSAQHDDNARLNDALAILAQRIEASQLALVAQTAMLQRVASSLDVTVGEINARKTASINIRTDGAGFIAEAKKH